jgi:hypothetical protein
MSASFTNSPQPTPNEAVATEPARPGSTWRNVFFCVLTIYLLARFCWRCWNWLF